MVGLNFCVIFFLVLLMAEVYSANLTELKSFRCHNGSYISGEFVCNGIYKDCGDGSDEFNACDKENCGAGKFKCVRDGSCLNITAYCNTIKDCSDGFDEWNCGSEVEVQDCHFHKGKFLCNDNLKCLDLEYTCDGDCNCFDCSDENDNCTKIVATGNLLIYTTPTRIKALNLTTNKVSIIENQVECATLTAAHDNVYFTKLRDDGRTIYKMSMSSKTMTEILSSAAPISSVAIDYITNNLYFSTETSVFACSKEDKRSCKRVICCDASHIALAPRLGIMFFTRRAPRDKRKYIFKSNMDGSDENIVIDGTFNDPVSLTVDESTEILYWLEKQEKKIHSIPISGFYTQIKSVEHGGDNSTSSITVFNKKVIFVKNQSNIISSIENFQDSQLYWDTSTLSIELLYSYNPFLQQNDKIVNPCEANPCPSKPENICLLRPSFSSNSLHFKCSPIDEE